MIELALLIAQLELSPMALMATGLSTLAAATGVLYRDCRKDREKMWEYMRNLDKRKADKS